MPLTTGSRLGSYEIVGALGAGGMGEVYRARDTKLNRDVALKILPEAFATDPDRLARFSREAQTLAALNHPHIAQIHGLEESGSIRALVMELVEGENLAARIARGAVPFAEALPIARQIVDALDAAHEKGIIHRDLKPANIMLTADGQVKVLDFGLAKLAPGASGESGGMMTHSPTLTFNATQAGIILGTAAYMSPEQAKGRVADKRSDVWAFGCVFFEMLTGTRAFEGEDLTDTIAAVMRGEPAWTALPSDVPEQIRLLLKRCLEKDRRVRVSDIGVARFLMTETIAAPAATIAVIPAGPPPRSRRRVVAGAGIAVMAAVALLAMAVWVGTRLVPARVLQPARFAIVPPAPRVLHIQGTDRDIAISPDGGHIVYRAGTGPDGQTQLVVRSLNDLDARPLAGITGVREPFMSPDGRWIGFFTAAELRKVSITGGPPITICRTVAAPRGASWGPDDTIVFSIADPRSGLLSVPAGGGEPKVLTTADPNKGEAGHFFPFVLPGGRAVLFTIAAGAVVVAGGENAQVAVLDLKTGQRKTIIRGGADAVYVDPSTSARQSASAGSGPAGYLVYAAAGTLRAVQFDLTRLEVMSDPVPIVEQVMTAATGEANYALSRQGTLVYVPGGAAAAPTAQPRSLVWVNRQGREEPIKAPPRPYAIARLSPDGTRVALDIRDQTNDIWTWDLGRQTLTALNLDPAVDMSPLWTPDGRRIIWTSTRGGGNPNLYSQASDGTGVPVRLTTNVSAQFPTSMSPDGTHLAIFGPPASGALPFTGAVQGMATPGAGAALDVSVVTLQGSSTPGIKPLIQSVAGKSNAEISPDGRWIAYQSDESGQIQIYVRPFPKVDSGRSQISPAGGTRPAWARNGRELFYLDGNELLTSVAVQTTETTFTAGTPTKILDTRYYAGSSTRGFDLRAYDVSPDGKRFLMIKDMASADPKSAAPAASMVVVLNWFEELQSRVPLAR